MTERRLRLHDPFVFVLAVGLAVLLAPGTAPCVEARQQQAAPSQHEHSPSAKVRDALDKAGPSAKVTVYLADKSKLSGHLTSVDDTSFTLTLNDTAHTHRTVPYDTVVKIKVKPVKSGGAMGDTKAFLLIMGTLLGLIVIFGIIGPYLNY